MINWSEFFSGPNTQQEGQKLPSVPEVPTGLPEAPQVLVPDPEELEETMHEVPISVSAGIPDEKANTTPEASSEITNRLEEKLKEIADLINEYGALSINIFENPEMPNLKTEMEGLKKLIETIVAEVASYRDDYDKNAGVIAPNNLRDLYDAASQLQDQVQYIEAEFKYLNDYVTLDSTQRENADKLTEAYEKASNPAQFIMDLIKNGWVMPTTLQEDGSQILPVEDKLIPEPAIDEADTAPTKPIVEPPIPDGATVVRPPVDAKPADLSETAPHPAVTEPIKLQRPAWQQTVAGYMPPKLQEKLDTITARKSATAQPERSGQPDARQWLSDQFAAMPEMSVAGRVFDLRGMTNYLGQMVDRMNVPQPADRLKVAVDAWNRLAGPERTMILALMAVVGRSDGNPMLMDPELLKQYQSAPEAREIARILTEKLGGNETLNQTFTAEYLPVLKDLFVSARMLQGEPKVNPPVGAPESPKPNNNPGPEAASLPPQNPNVPEQNSDESKKIEALRQQNIAEIKAALKAIDVSSLTRDNIVPGHVAAARIQLPRVVGVITMGVNSAEKYGKLAENLKKIGIESVLKAALAQEKFDPAALGENTRKSLEVLRT